ncbi:MAG TPA: diguanylate cyclase [Gemmatimonadota bacterium]|nr:diguanylate cyclase [Gemmatimonadota bacterium]
MQIPTTPTTKTTLVALRLCAAAATGVLLWSYPPAAGLARGTAVVLWAVYAGTAIGLPMVPHHWFERPRLLPIFTLTELVLLGGFVTTYQAGGSLYLPLFLVTILLAAFARNVRWSITVATGAALAQVPLYATGSDFGGLDAMAIESSALILQGVILLVAGAAVGHLTEELSRHESTGDLLDSALQISALVAGTYDVDTVYRRLVELVARLLQADRVAMIQLTDEPDVGRVVAAADLGHPLQQDLYVDLPEHPEVAEAIARQSPIVVRRRERRSDPKLGFRRRVRRTSILVAPILVGDDPRGVLYIRNERSRIEYSRQELAFCQLMAHAAARAVEHAERYAAMEEAASRDPLTGLRNLRAFHQRLDLEIARSEREVRPLSLLMIDIDYLKRVNDAFGHLAGDAVLRDIARILGEQVREVDFVARYGGEEFAVLLTGAEIERAQKIAERICAAIGSMDHPDVDAPVTASIGVATYPYDAITPRDLVHQADQALYYSKYRGRNRITVYDHLHRQASADELQRELVQAFTSVSLERHFSHDDPHIAAIRERLSLFTSDREIIDNIDDVIESLTVAMHARDTYTRHHLRQAAALSDLFLGYLTIDDDERRTIRIACMLHDIGKLGIPQEILQKSEFLTREEYEIVRKHPEIGARILEPLKAFTAAVPCIRHHHERWDGKGYPDGLRGAGIPFGARVVSLVDSFHAMVSKRPYQSRVKGLGYAREEIRRNAGTQFDPELAALFVQMTQEQPERMAGFVESEPALSASEDLEYAEFTLRADVVGSTWAEVD